MRTVAGLLVICLVVAALRAAVVALVVALLLTLLWSFITRPTDTILFVVVCALSCVAVAQPFACIAGVTVMAIVLGLAGRRRNPLPTLQLGRHQ